MNRNTVRRVVHDAAAGAGGAFGASLAEEFMRYAAPRVRGQAEEFIRSPAWQEFAKNVLQSSAPPPQLDNSPYRVLGVAPGDPMALVNSVHRVKAAFWHPDKDTGNVQRFREVQEAYEAIKKLRGG